MPNHACKPALLDRPASGRPAEHSRSAVGRAPSGSSVPAPSAAGAATASAPSEMASWRSDGPGQPDRTDPQETLVGLSPQPRNDPALASRARAPQVGRLRQAPTPSSAGDGPRGHRPDPQVGSREPKVGVPPDPGRATEAGTPVFTRDCPQGDAVASGATSAQAVNANVGGVRSPARRAPARDRLLHRGDGLARPPLRALLHRGRQPPRSSRWRLRAPDGSMGGAAGSESGLAPSGRRPLGDAPAARS